MLATALACDQTRVFSYEFSACQSQTYYWEVGVNQEHHQLTHDKPAGPEMQKIVKFIMKNFAYLARALKAMPEPGGDVLDRTLILGTSSIPSPASMTGRTPRSFWWARPVEASRPVCTTGDPNPGNVNAPGSCCPRCEPWA